MMPNANGNITLDQFDENILPMKESDDKNHSNFSDPAFSRNKSYPIHRWVPWIAGFSKEFVNDSIMKYVDGSGTILEPFAGVGTTLVEALLTGNDAYGFEINPYAAFACRTKLNSYTVDESELREEIEGFFKFYKSAIQSNYVPKSSAPAGFKTRIEFYSPKVLAKVLIVQDYIKGIEVRSIQDLFRLAFASTMVKYSNYSYEPSLGTRIGSGKKNIEDFEVGETLIQKLVEYLKDISWVKKIVNTQHPPCIEVINDSFFEYKSHLPKDSIDLIITSPPYLNNYHYNRNTRPQLYWLDFVNSPKDLKPLENNNFGNFWQTVRDKEGMCLIFNADFIDLEERLDKIRSVNPDKKTYGGNGWANYAISYFNDCYLFSQGIKHCLKRDATALVVIGNSILQGVAIPTDEYFGKIAESIGLELVEIHVPRSKRVGNSIIQSDVRVSKAKKGHRLYEAVVELRKL